MSLWISLGEQKPLINQTPTQLHAKPKRYAPNNS
jgi:hypothetical protein